MFCTNCGSQIPDDAKFCTECGKPITDEHLDEARAEEAPSYEDNSSEHQDIPVMEKPEEAASDTPVENQAYNWYAPPAREQPAPTPDFAAREVPGYQAVPVYNKAPGYPDQQAYQQPDQPQTYDQKYQAPQKKNSIPIIVIFCIIGVAIIGVLVWMFAGGLPGGIGSGRGYDTPEELMSVYFGAFQEGNERTVVGLVLPELVDYAILNGYSKDELTEELDDFYDDYGNKVSSWYVSGKREYSVYYEDFEDVGIDGSRIQKFMNYTTEVTLGGPSSYNELTIDFDLVQIDGRWYLTDIW